MVPKRILHSKLRERPSASEDRINTSRNKDVGVITPRPREDRIYRNPMSTVLEHHELYSILNSGQTFEKGIEDMKRIVNEHYDGEPDPELFSETSANTE